MNKDNIDFLDPNVTKTIVNSDKVDVNLITDLKFKRFEAFGLNEPSEKLQTTYFIDNCGNFKLKYVLGDHINQQNSKLEKNERNK